MKLLECLFKGMLLMAVAGQVAALDLKANTSPAMTTTDRQVDAQILIHAPDGISANSRFYLGVQLTHKPGWHTYWINPGDSGLPTTLNWTLPSGMKPGPIQWPLPKKITVADLTNYGFEGQTLLVVPVEVDSSFRGSGDLQLGLEANWLACENACIPESAQIQARFPLGAQAPHSSSFQLIFDQQPRARSAERKAKWAGQELDLSISDLPVTWRGRSVEAFPLIKESLASSMERNGSAQWVDDSWQMKARIHDMNAGPILNLPVVLVSYAQGKPEALEVVFRIEGDWPKPMPATSAAPASGATIPSANSSTGTQGSSILWACLGAFIGGLLLNLMPCVLPVLSIKALSLATSHSNARQRHIHGLAFALGTVGTLSILGLVLLVLRATGSQLGWGFHLQSPWMMLFLITLFALMAFNLWGLFEWPSFSFSEAVERSPTSNLWNSIGSGALTVLVASPCTAPFMGASLGLALTLPSWAAMPIFVSLGIGLALPLTLLSWSPRLSELIPRPGAWMLRLRQGLGFPMMATSLWLMWVLNQQTNAQVTGLTSFLLLMLAALLTTHSLTPKWRWPLRLLLSALCVLGLHQWVIQLKSTDVATQVSAQPGTWQTWSPEAVDQARQAGRAVFVDFTAAWCITCQYNEKAVLARDDVMQAFANKKVVPFKADWTKQDPRITQALKSLGRSGVPVYVLYAPGQPAQLFPEILTPGDLSSALNSLP